MKLPSVQKLPTGIAGLDLLTNGGLPRSRASIVIGASGTGKTTLAFQILFEAARRGETGLFVAFEESEENILANVSSFGWNLGEHLDRRLFIVDANLPPETILAGKVDLGGLLASLGALARRQRARWIVFDAIDVLISLLPSAQAGQRELFRIRAWLKDTGLTAVLTIKEDRDGRTIPIERDMISYIADCTILLRRVGAEAFWSNGIQVLKYRGSTHWRERVPYWIGAKGFEVDAPIVRSAEYPVYRERVSTGIAALDRLLRGGILRGGTMLLTGAPGTSKSTLCGKFAQAACARGERTLYVTFDESPGEVVRNLRSVGVDMTRHLAAGRIRFYDLDPRVCSADRLYLGLRDMMDEFRPRCLVIDPISALKEVGSAESSARTSHRIVQQCKRRGITTFLASVMTKGYADIEGSETHISTLADNWIHLSYLVRNAERNRALTIVKARGTGHSNQVRELVLSDHGVTLVDVYLEKGEVLMGNMRAQKEGEAKQDRILARREAEHAKEVLATGIAELEARLVAVRGDLALRRRQFASLAKQGLEDEATAAKASKALAERRGCGPSRGGSGGSR